MICLETAELINFSLVLKILENMLSLKVNGSMPSYMIVFLLPHLRACINNCVLWTMIPFIMASMTLHNLKNFWQTEPAYTISN